MVFLQLHFTAAVRDVSKWSARMRQPMEEMYGAEVFAKMWEAWVDGMSAYAQRPEGREPAALLTSSNRIFLMRVWAGGCSLEEDQRENASLNDV